MIKFAACVCAIAATSYIDNPLASLKTESIYGIIYAQMDQGICAKTPAIEEAQRRLFDDELTAAEEVELLALGAELAVCNVRKEQEQANKQ